MSNYYFDTETEGFDPKEHKLLTVQYQEIDSKGFPIGELTILKEWEIGEKKLVELTHNLLINKNVWDFVPILTNHIFDFTFLFKKFEQYNLKTPELITYLYTN